MEEEAVERRKIRLKMRLTNLMEFKKELYRPQVRAAAPQVDTRTARERSEQQIASAQTYIHIDMHGNRTVKERKR